MTDKYAELRAAIDAGPTPGPWFHGAKNGEHKYCVYDKVCWTDGYGRHGDTPNMIVHVSPDDGTFRDAAYIAAADPGTIRALLAERDHLAMESTGLNSALLTVMSERDRAREALEKVRAVIEADRQALLDTHGDGRCISVSDELGTFGLYEYDAALNEIDSVLIVDDAAGASGGE